MSGYGTTLAYDATGFQSLAKVTNIDGPGLSQDMIEFLCMDAATQMAEKIAGAMHLGQVTVDLVFSGATADKNYGTLLGFWGTSKSWKITFPDTSYCTFTAFVAGVSPSIPVGAEITCSATLEVTTLPVQTPV